MMEAMSNPLSSFDLEKIDNADQTLGENFLDGVGMDGQTPMNYDEEPHGKDRSSSPHSPCKSILTELKSKNKCLVDAKGIHETLDIHQGGGAKESKYYNASVLYLSLHNISIESDEKLQLPAHYAKYHTSETSV